MRNFSRLTAIVGWLSTFTCNFRELESFTTKSSRTTAIKSLWEVIKRVLRWKVFTSAEIEIEDSARKSFLRVGEVGRDLRNAI
jgi:hypothetical protein